MDRFEDRAVYVISVAAELAGVHPQTLRIYERKGLIEPQRTTGRSRRYSERDITRLQRIQELTTGGVSLAVPDSCVIEKSPPSVTLQGQSVSHPHQG